MPKATKEKKKKSRKPRVIVYDLPGKGNIDPRLIRKAVIEVIDRRRQREAEAKGKTMGEPTGTSRDVEEA